MYGYSRIFCRMTRILALWSATQTLLKFGASVVKTVDPTRFIVRNYTLEA